MIVTDKIVGVVEVNRHISERFYHIPLEEVLLSVELVIVEDKQKAKNNYFSRYILQISPRMAHLTIGRFAVLFFCCEFLAKESRAFVFFVIHLSTDIAEQFTDFLALIHLCTYKHGVQAGRWMSSVT